MPQKWEKVYVFVSSPFIDMHAERDYLVKNVFPQLEDWCEKRRLRLVDIDLRWGVTEQDTQNKTVVKACLEKIDACPFFLCFLGQRRGWVPKKEDISAETFESFPELESLVGSISATELEIRHALITPLHQNKTRASNSISETIENVRPAFFYLRDPSYLSEMPSGPALLRQTYTNELIKDPQERAITEDELQKWRDAIEDLRCPVHHYTAKWNDEAATPELRMHLRRPSSEPSKIKKWRDKLEKVNSAQCIGRLTDFECDNKALSSVILEDLKTAITARYPDHKEIEEHSDLEREMEQQELFIFMNSEGFYERKSDFSELDNYVNGDSNKLFVLTGPGGSGKSMLLANWVDRYRRRVEGSKGSSVHFRFIGQSDKSTTVYSLLSFLLLEIQKVGHKLNEPIPEEPQRLLEAWPRLLEAIGRKGKTVIVLDAINQLESGLSKIDWIPWRLPPNIKLIVSFKRGEQSAEKLLKKLEGSGQVWLSEVKPFKVEDRKELVHEYLKQYLKDLDEQHLKAIIQSKGADSPLYLKIVLNELRVFGAFSNLKEKITKDFGEKPESAFEGLLNRLESDPVYSPVGPKAAVSLLFGLMAHARHGLSAEELASLFIQELKPTDTKEPKKTAEDSIYLFLRQVRPYLAHREGRYDFFYESFKNAAQNDWHVKKTPEQDRPKRLYNDWHRILGEYFGSLPTWQKNATIRIATIRKVSELPYHQTCGQLWNELEKTLSDLDFIEAKCASGMTYDLINDYYVALGALPEAQKEVQERLRREARVKKYADDLIAYAKGELNHLDIIPSVELWSKEKIDQDSDMIINKPSRLDRIRAFAQFVNSESHNLFRFSSFPGFTIQQAYNSSRNSPVVKVAEPIASNVVNYILLLQVSTQRQEYNPHPALLKTLLDRNISNRVIIAPDGKKAVSASLNDTLKVWDIGSGKCLKTLQGIEYVGWTADGRKAVSASRDGALKVWDLESGQCLKTLKQIPIDEHEGWRIVLTPDGEKAVLACQETIFPTKDGILEVWDLESGQCKTLQGHTNNFYNMTFFRKLFISKSFVGRNYNSSLINIWHLESGQCLKTLKQKGSSEYWIITPDGKKIISICSKGTLKVCDLENGKCKILQGDPNAFDHMDITPDGRKAISACETSPLNVGDGEKIEDFRLKVWDLESGQCLKILHGHTGGINCVSLTPDGRKAISASMDGTLRVWDLESGQCLKTPHSHTGAINHVVLTADGRKAISASQDHKLKVWDFESGKCLKKLHGHTSSVDNVNLTIDGKKAISASFDGNGTLELWNIENGVCGSSSPCRTGSIEYLSLKTIHGYRAPILTPDGERAISRSYWDGSVWVWDIESGEIFKILQQTDVKNVVLTPDGKKAITTRLGDGTLRLWDLESGQCLKTLKQIEGDEQLLLTPDGKTAISASQDRTLRLWDLESGQCLKTLKQIEGDEQMVLTPGEQLLLTPDGRKAVLTGLDGILEVWDLESGQCKTLQGHTNTIICMSLTPDGGKVVSASQDDTIRLWDLESGQCLAIYPIESLNSLSNITAIGNFALGTDTGDAVFLIARNLVVKPPIVTPVRLWLYRREQKGSSEKSKASKGWADDVTVICLWCDNRFPVSQEKLEAIRAINKNANLAPDQSPCLKLPDEAWKDSRLLLECPICHKPLKLNPFIVDNSPKTEEIKRTYLEPSQDKFTAQEWFEKGYTFLSLGQKDEAIKCYSKALEINPQQAIVWFNKAFVEDKLWLKTEAAASYRKFLELSSASQKEFIELARKRLRKLEGRRSFLTRSVET